MEEDKKLILETTKEIVVAVAEKTVLARKVLDNPIDTKDLEIVIKNVFTTLESLVSQ